MTIFGSDTTSQYQPGYNFKEAADDGIRVAGIKLSQGHTGVPQGTGDYVRRADAAIDLLLGYHFLDATMSGSAQAEMFVNAGRRMFGGWQGRLAAVDFEFYRGPGWDLTPGNSHLLNFVRTFKALTGGHAIFCYTTARFWKGLDPGTVPSGDPRKYDIDAMWEARVFANEEYRPHFKSFYQGDWLEWYRDQKDRLMYDSAPTIGRQFTWGGVAGGIHPVDIDAFEATIDELETFTH